MLRHCPSIYARRLRFLALLALAVLLPIRANAFRVLETKLVFSKAEMPDMSKCLAPAEESKSVFQLSTGFVWYWVKLKDYVHDTNVTIRIINPATSHVAYAWKDHALSRSQRDCVSGSFNLRALFKLFGGEQLLAQFLYEGQIMTSSPFSIYAPDSTVVLRSMLGYANNGSRINCDFDAEDKHDYKESRYPLTPESIVYYCIDVGHHLEDDNSPFTFEYVKPDDGTVLSTYRNAGEHINGMVLYMPIKTRQLVITKPAGGKFNVRFSYNGRVEDSRDFSVVEGLQSPSEQEFWEEENGINPNPSKGIFGLSRMEDATEPPKKKPKPVAFFCPKYNECTPDY